ncbi:phosphotransferase enzyme family protein [Pseudanabaena sp. SR411]|uniref:phosphotransferase enzyme family protein n=1 Tax=Pseudanabaena sp. SR411 TaxID=1980935 RepID=UPI0015953FFF|nr:phosphotransferase [Pseudanabaena sp. SR411]
MLNKMCIWQAVLNNYSIGDIASINPISNSRNSLFNIITNNKCFIARVSRIENKDNISHILPLQEYLFYKCAPVSRPMRRLDGGYITYVSNANNLYYLSVEDFILGKIPSVNINDFFIAGAYLALFHEISNSYPNYSDIPHSNLDVLLFQPTTYITDRVSSELAQQVDNLCQQLGQILDSLKEQVSFGICHGDSHHYNMHLSNDKIVFFDLEDVKLSWRVYDIATMIWGTFGQGGNGYIWNAVIQGYNSVSLISDYEAQIIKYFVAIRQIWWLGLHACRWGDWIIHKDEDEFFQRGVELFFYICREGCGIAV